MKLGPIIEVIVYVSDMQRAVLFYTSLLGFEVVYPTCNDYSQEYWVVLDTGAAKLCLHGGNKGHQGADAPKVVFHVDDIHIARDELIAKGLFMEPVFSPTKGVLVSNSKDPDGNRFSIESATHRASPH